MTFPQSTLEEITESERQMLLTAMERFGDYYVNARTSSVFMSRCIISVNHDRLNFARFFALMKKHHMLALLSLARLHKAQAMMNLRQALEAGAAAAFAIANPEDKHFFTVGKDGLIRTPSKLALKRYAWLEKNFSAHSAVIKANKDLINEYQSHANVISANSVFAVASTGDLIDAPFFDREDEHFVKIDLWLTASIAVELTGLFHAVNQTCDVIEFVDNFPAYFQRLANDTAVLRKEMMATDRYRAQTARANADKS